MRLDHISYACTSSELPDVVQRIGSELGATFIDGGRHPSFGTRNFILPLSRGSYVEVVSALDHPAALKAPFGQAVQARASAGGGWMSWVISVDDLSPLEAQLGREAAAGHRIRPDGVELRWKQLGVLDTMTDPQLPFFVSWECDGTEHPSAGAVAGVGVDRIEISGEQATVDEWAGFPIAPSNAQMDWISSSNDEGVIAVWFTTSHGIVRID
jgi:hypothetical protein